jgi:hypothetical protein
MTVHYYKYSRNARAAARRVGLDPDVVVQPAPAGFYSVDFGDIEPTEPEPQGDGEPVEAVAVEPQPEESEPVVEDKPAPDMAELYKDIASGEFKEVFGEPTALDVALANAHLDGIPACLQRAPESAEETAAREERLAHYAKDASPERELVVRKTSAAAPKEAKPTKIAAVLEKAKDRRHHHGRGQGDDGLVEDRRILRRHQAGRPDADQGCERSLSRRVSAARPCVQSPRCPNTRRRGFFTPARGLSAPPRGLARHRIESP